jgi:MarR family 2-MHQ and catechol resistance regulon transcriptional repressor
MSSQIDPALARDAAFMQELYTAGQLVNVLVSRELEDAGVSPQDFSFLGWIAQFQPVTPGRLAAETGLPATTIRDYVRRSLQRGLVRKRPNPEDGRSYNLQLTAEGQRQMDRGWPTVVAAYARLLPHLADAPRSLGEVRALRAALREAVAEHEHGRETVV